MINNLEIKIPNTIKNISFGSQNLSYNFRFFDTAFPFRTLNLWDEGFSQVIFTAKNSFDDSDVLFRETVSLTASSTGDITLTLGRAELKRCTADLSIELATLSGASIDVKYKQDFTQLIKVK